MNYVKQLPFEPPVLTRLSKLIDLLLSSEIDPTKIVLFGSYARAEYKVTSDLDILVLTDCEVPRTIRGELCSQFEELNSDLIFYTNEAFSNSECLFVKQVKKEGILLWES